jgi:hypothetical protein
VRAERPRLLARPPGEIAPADAVREPGVVPDHRAASGLPAGDGFFQHHRQQALGCSIDSRGETGRASPDNGDVAAINITGDAPAG